MADESIPTKKKPDITVTASPLPTLMEQIIEGQQEILDQPGATPPQPPRQLSVGERLNLAFAGLDPQFRRDVVQPEVEKRRGFTESVRQFEREETERKQKALAGALPAAVAEQKQIDEAKEEAAQTERFKQAFTAIANDYMNVAEQIQDVTSVLERTGNASDALRGRDLIRRAATVQQVLQNADAGQPVNDDVLKFAQGELKELQAAIAVATTGLASQESQARMQASVLERMAAGRSLPNLTAIERRQELRSAISSAKTISDLIDAGYGGPAQQIPSSWLAYVPFAKQADFVQKNTALRAAMSNLATLLIPQRLGANIPEGEREFARGILLDPKTSTEQIKAGINAVQPFMDAFLADIETRFMFGDSITGPSPGLPPGTVEFSTMDDATYMQLKALQQGAQ